MDKILISVFTIIYYQTNYLKKFTILSYGLIFLFFFVFIYYYKYVLEEIQLKCIISDKNGEIYCVRDRKKVKKAANLLATVVIKCQKMVDYMAEKHPDDERTKRLIQGFRSDKISETLPTSELTAYSENKGEKIAFCLNKDKENNDQLIDINTLTFVALHELSHIMTESIGHKQDFWQNFKFLLQNAKEASIYNPIDYKKKPFWFYINDRVYLYNQLDCLE
jgi:hypothetical protein